MIDSDDRFLGWRRLRRRLSYANVTATLALFLALGGTSYAVLSVGSRDVVDNSLRSKDIRNNSLRSKDLMDRSVRGRDLRRSSIGGRVIREGSLARVPEAANSQRLDGRTAADLRVRCPADTISMAGVCIETSARSAQPFGSAVNACGQVGRTLPLLTELDPFARSNGPVSEEGEWTSSVFLEEPSTATTFERLEALLVKRFGDVDHARVNAPTPHPFRCVVVPSN